MLPMVVLAVLIVVNLGLLYLLFRPDLALTAEPADQDRGEGALPAPTSSPTVMPSPSAPAEQTTSPSPSASKDPTSSTRPIKPAPAQRLLFAATSKTAWRATVGDCNTPGQVERSTDGGASWKPIDRAGLAPIVRLGASQTAISSPSVVAVGAVQPAIWRMRTTARSRPLPTTPSTSGSQPQRIATKSMGPATQKPVREGPRRRVRA